MRGAPLAGADGQHLYLPNFLDAKSFGTHDFCRLSDDGRPTSYDVVSPRAARFPGSGIMEPVHPACLCAHGVLHVRLVLTITESKLAALTSGVILGMSGFMMAHLGHAVVIHSVAWVPLQLWSYEKLRGDGVPCGL